MKIALRTISLGQVVFGLALALGAGVYHSAPLHAQSAAPSYQLEGNKLVVPGPVVFKVGSAELTGDSAAVLNHVKSYLTDKSYISTLRIEGHVGSGGDESANQNLSEARAKAVAEYLVKNGVECARVLPVGFGSTKPIAANSTLEGRAQNTRVEFQNAALRGRAIGGMPLDGGGNPISSWKCP